jgi:hypothetical protein
LGSGTGSRCATPVRWHVPSAGRPLVGRQEQQTAPPHLSPVLAAQERVGGGASRGPAVPPRSWRSCGPRTALWATWLRAARVAIPGPRAVPCDVVGSSGLRVLQRSTITRNSSHQCWVGPSQDQRVISMSPVPPSSAVLPVGPAGAAHDGHVGASIVQWADRSGLAGAGRDMDRSPGEDIRSSPRISTPSSDVSTDVLSARILMRVLPGGRCGSNEGRPR